MIYRKFAGMLTAFGILLHAYECFLEADGKVTGFVIGMFIWSLIPYAALGLLLLKAQHPLRTLCAALAVVGLDIEIHLEVFVWPSSSTAGIALLWMPLYETLLFIPAGLGVGWFIERLTVRKRLS